SRHSDQYSLAIVFQELLTGTLPFQGKNARQLLLAHACLEPDLTALSAEDRAVLARALAKDPQQRFACCTDLVRALTAVRPAGAGGRPAPRPSFGALASPGAADPPPPASAGALDHTTSNADTTPMPDVEPPPPYEALAGLQFLDCLGSSPLVDTWRAQAEDG